MNTKNDFMALTFGDSSGMGMQRAMRLPPCGFEPIPLSYNMTRLKQAKAKLEMVSPFKTTAVNLCDAVPRLILNITYGTTRKMMGVTISYSLKFR